jgi:hypothetical protein
VIVIPTDDYSADPAEVEAAVRRVRARLVKVVSEDVPQSELEDLLGAALVSSGVRPKV